MILTLALGAKLCQPNKLEYVDLELSVYGFIEYRATVIPVRLPSLYLFVILSLYCVELYLNMAELELGEA